MILRSTRRKRRPALSKDDTPPLTYTHFKAEGDETEKKSILFVPERAPHDMFDNYYNKAAALKLKGSDVFISKKTTSSSPSTSPSSRASSTPIPCP